MPLLDHCHSPICARHPRREAAQFRPRYSTIRHRRKTRDATSGHPIVTSPPLQPIQESKKKLRLLSILLVSDRIGYCVYRLRINGGCRGRRTAISTSRCGPSFSEPPGPLLLLRGPSTLVVFPCSNGATVAGNGVGAVGAIGAFRPAVRFRFGLRPVREVVRGLSEESQPAACLNSRGKPSQRTYGSRLLYLATGPALRSLHVLTVSTSVAKCISICLAVCAG